MMGRKRPFLFIMVCCLLWLAGCEQAAPESLPTATAVLPQPSATPTTPPTALPSATMGVETAVATLTNTPAPTPTTKPVIPTITSLPPEATQSSYPINPFPGIVYKTGEGLWRINAQGHSELLFEKQGALESDGRRLLYAQDDDIWLIDLVTGDQKNVTNTPDTIECCPQWWPSTPDTFLIATYHEEDIFEFVVGKLARVTLDGSYETFVEEAVPPYPAISPNGQMIVTEIADIPALYYYETGKIEWLTLQPVDMPTVWKAGNPVWSPDGQKLAWVTYFRDDEERILIALLIYHLGNSEIKVLHPYYPSGHGSWGPKPVWHPDGNFITLFAIDQDSSKRGLWMISIDGDEEWNLGEVSNLLWSPDGSSLIYQSEDDFYLTFPPEFADKIQVNMPTGARMIEWQVDP
ncbi:MAG: hypothetical protein R6X34_11090 [Chloroflexota bacterium]